MSESALHRSELGLHLDATAGEIGAYEIGAYMSGRVPVPQMAAE